MLDPLGNINWFQKTIQYFPQEKRTQWALTFVPIAVPMIAKPSFITTILLYNEIETDSTKILTALIIAWLISVTIYLNHTILVRALKKNGLRAIERLIGMILVMISIQRLLEAIKMIVVDLSVL